MPSVAAIARIAMSRRFLKARCSARSAREYAPTPLIPRTPKRFGPRAKKWWASASDRSSNDQFFRVVGTVCDLAAVNDLKAYYGERRWLAAFDLSDFPEIRGVV